MRQPPPRWQIATIERIEVQTPRVKTFALSLERRFDYRPGQHVDIRLTAPDGYQARRNYSIASAPEALTNIELAIELIPGGEVSPYFHIVARVGDRFHLRGPIGGPFTWLHPMGGPLLLVAGGSGIAPLMSMLRHRRAQRVRTPTALIYSSRSLDDVIYREELADMAGRDRSLSVMHTLTQTRPDGWQGYARRIDAGMMRDALARVGSAARVYVCGSDRFVETVSDLTADAGIAPENVHTERFGPSGQ